MIHRMNDRQGFNVTINTTEDCNLACKYCYEINKKKKNINIDTAKKFIDILIETDDIIGLDLMEDKESEDYKFEDTIMNKAGITLDFIGGDSLMDVDTLDEIIKYFVFKLATSNTKNANLWRYNWRLSLSSNGTLFSDPKVRKFCEKYKDVLSLGVSIDGCPEIHDMNRVFKDGSPSMPAILENLEWYKKTFPLDSQQTKATCSRDSIPYLYDSLVFMHENLGLKYINQNFIMEDTGCTEEDYKLLEEQMEKCINYVFEHRDELYWSMIDLNVFAKHHRSEGSDWDCKGHCGSGSMPALSIDGDIYPCFRWLPHTQEQKNSSIIVGNIKDGFNNREGFVRVREGAYRKNCTKEEKCVTCEYESACSYCIGGCFSEFGEFKRTTYICEITKIQCEYAKKYWNMVGEVDGKNYLQEEQN